MERHFCATVYLYDFNQEKFVFVNHRKLGRWVPPGGHLDLSETPEIAAAREVREETGLQIRIIGRENPVGIPAEDGKELLLPFGMAVYPIAPLHEHMDFIYLGLANGDGLRINDRETAGLDYFSLQEILDESFNTFFNVRQWCQFFDQFLRQNAGILRSSELNLAKGSK